MSPAVTLMRRTLVRAVDGGATALHRLATEDVAPNTARLLRVALLGWVGLSTLVMLPRHAEFFGDGAYLVRDFSPATPLHWVVQLANHPALGAWYPAFILGQLACVAIAMAGRWPRLATLGALVFTLNLYHRCPVVADGGSNLAWILLGYLVFVRERGCGAARSGVLGHLAVAASNVALRLCALQVATVYLTAGFCKLLGEHWQSGTALFYILQVPNYAHPTIAPPLVEAWPILMAANYATIAFQIAFAMFVWQRRFRPVLFAAGVALHLGIAVVMGLPAFGLVMCLVYVAFFPDAWSAATLAYLRPHGALRLEFDPRHRGARVIAAVASHLGAAVPVAAMLDVDGLRATSGGVTTRGAAAIGPVLAHTPVLRWLRPLVSTLAFLGVDALLWRHTSARSAPSPSLETT